MLFVLRHTYTAEILYIGTQYQPMFQCPISIIKVTYTENRRQGLAKNLLSVNLVIWGKRDTQTNALTGKNCSNAVHRGSCSQGKLIGEAVHRGSCSQGKLFIGEAVHRGTLFIGERCSQGKLFIGEGQYSWSQDC